MVYSSRVQRDILLRVFTNNDIIHPQTLTEEKELLRFFLIYRSRSQLLLLMNYDSFLPGSILSIILHVKFLRSVNLVPEQSISILGMYVKHISELLSTAVIFDLFVPTLMKKIRHIVRIGK